MAKIAFLFPGQGAQVTGMGQDFYENYPEAKEVFDIASKDSEDNVYDWRNIVFVKDMDEAASNFMENDVYLEYRGETVLDSGIESLDDTYHLIMPDYTAKGINLVKEISVEGTPFYIFRDMCTKKVTDKSFALDCGLSKEDVLGHIELSGEDMAAYVTWSHNGHQKFDKCSANMQDALAYVTGVILDIKKDKDIAKTLKLALKKVK